MLIELILEFLEGLFDTPAEVTILIFIGIALVLILLVREIFTWYWKINKMVAVQKEQKRLLQEILSQLKNNK